MRTKTKRRQPPGQATLTVAPEAAKAGITGGLLAKGYEVTDIQCLADAIYTVTYFPESAIKGPCTITGLTYAAMLERVAALPDAPQLDAWTRLALDKGPQRGYYHAEADHERFIDDGQCMDCRVLSPVTTRGEGMAKVALCGYCAKDFDRRTGTQQESSAETMIIDSIDDDTLIHFL